MKTKSILLSLFLLFVSIVSYAQQSGTLDGDFDANGSVITSITSGDDRAKSVVVQPDGKIVATGTSGSQGFGPEPSDYSTVRYLSDGSLDASFGTNGIVTTSLGTLDRANDIALQQDGKIVVGGTSTGILSTEAFAIVRYNQDGTIDTSFITANQSGVFMGPLGDCRAIAIQADGKIVAAGFASIASFDFVVARYNTNGTIDNTFGTTGVVTTDFGGLDDFALSVAIQSDGKIVVAGRSHNGLDFDFAVVRYDSHGSLDNSFSVNGMVTADFGNGSCTASKVVVQSDGKILTVGRTANEFQTFDNYGLVRFNSDGTLDSSFGLSGKVITAIEGGAFSAVLQPDGKIIVVGGFTSFLLLRYHPDGTLDEEFGVDGVAEEAIGIGSTRATSCALQPDGKIVAASFATIDFAGSDVGYAVARFISGFNMGVVSFSSQNNAMLIYPNPVQESAVLEYTLATDETINIELYGISGRLVQTFVRSEKRTKGNHKEPLVLDSSIPSGSYILTLSNGVGKSSIRVIK